MWCVLSKYKCNTRSHHGDNTSHRWKSELTVWRLPRLKTSETWCTVTHQEWNVNQSFLQLQQRHHVQVLDYIVCSWWWSVTPPHTHPTLHFCVFPFLKWSVWSINLYLPSLVTINQQKNVGDVAQIPVKNHIYWPVTDLLQIDLCVLFTDLLQICYRSQQTPLQIIMFVKKIVSTHKSVKNMWTYRPPTDHQVCKRINCVGL